MSDFIKFHFSIVFIISFSSLLEFIYISILVYYLSYGASKAQTTNL
jgi:hypothetical protein